jgi:hypothetical protein
LSCGKTGQRQTQIKSCAGKAAPAFIPALFALFSGLSGFDQEPHVADAIAEGVARIPVIFEVIKGHAFVCCLLSAIRPCHGGKIT